MLAKIEELEKQRNNAYAKYQEFKAKHHDWPENPEKAMTEISGALAVTEKKLDELKNAILKTDRSSEAIIDLRAQHEKLSKEIAKLNAFDLRHKEKEFLDYLKSWHTYQKLDAELKLLKESAKEPDVKMSAEVTRKSPFGKVPVPYDHLANLSKLSDYHKEFCKSHKLSLVESPDKLLFTSLDKKETIEVTKEGIKGIFDPDVKNSMMEAMIDLYLKSIDEKEIANHRIDSKNPALVSKLETELAGKLQKAGSKEALINGKKIEIILKEATSSPKL